MSLNDNTEGMGAQSPEEILRSVRAERAAAAAVPSADTQNGGKAVRSAKAKKLKAAKAPKAQKEMGHGFFKFVFSLNLLADAAICIYSAYSSKAPAVTVGMSVLALCFLIVIPGLILLRVTMRRSSAAMAGAAYTIINALIGFVFACEFFDLLPDTAAGIEGIAIGAMAVLIVLTVNAIVKRR